jgi:hypothetical protein
MGDFVADTGTILNMECAKRASYYMVFDSCIIPNMAASVKQSPFKAIFNIIKSVSATSRVMPSSLVILI